MADDGMPQRRATRSAVRAGDAEPPVEHELPPPNRGTRGGRRGTRSTTAGQEANRNGATAASEEASSQAQAPPQTPVAIHTNSPEVGKDSPSSGENRSREDDEDGNKDAPKRPRSRDEQSENGEKQPPSGTSIANDTQSQSEPAQTTNTTEPCDAYRNSLDELRASRTERSLREVFPETETRENQNLELDVLFQAIAAVTEAIAEGGGPSVSLLDSWQQQPIARPRQEMIYPVARGGRSTGGLNETRGGHLALFIFRPDGEGNDVTAEYYDSSFRRRAESPANVRMYEEARTALETLDWAGQGAPLIFPGRYQNAPIQVAQRNGWACGLHVIFSAWIHALGLQPLQWPQGRGAIHRDFYRDATVIVDFARDGRLSAETIRDFLECHGLIDRASQIPLARRFVLTHPFRDTEDLSRHVARVRLAEELDQLRAANPDSLVPTLDTALDDIRGLELENEFALWQIDAPRLVRLWQAANGIVDSDAAPNQDGASVVQGNAVLPGGPRDPRPDDSYDALQQAIQASLQPTGQPAAGNTSAPPAVSTGTSNAAQESATSAEETTQRGAPAGTTNGQRTQETSDGDKSAPGDDTADAPADDAGTQRTDVTDDQINASQGLVSTTGSNSSLGKHDREEGDEDGPPTRRRKSEENEDGESIQQTASMQPPRPTPGTLQLLTPSRQDMENSSDEDLASLNQQALMFAADVQYLEVVRGVIPERFADRPVLRLAGGLLGEMRPRPREMWERLQFIDRDRGNTERADEIRDQLRALAQPPPVEPAEGTTSDAQVRSLSTAEVRAESEETQAERRQRMEREMLESFRSYRRLGLLGPQTEVEMPRFDLGRVVAMPREASDAELQEVLRFLVESGTAGWDGTLAVQEEVTRRQRGRSRETRQPQPRASQGPITPDSAPEPRAPTARPSWMPAPRPAAETRAELRGHNQRLRVPRRAEGEQDASAAGAESFHQMMERLRQRGYVPGTSRQSRESSSDYDEAAQEALISETRQVLERADAQLQRFRESREPREQRERREAAAAARAAATDEGEVQTATPADGAPTGQLTGASSEVDAELLGMISEYLDSPSQTTPPGARDRSAADDEAIQEAQRLRERRVIEARHRDRRALALQREAEAAQRGDTSVTSTQARDASAAGDRAAQGARRVPTYDEWRVEFDREVEAEVARLAAVRAAAFEGRETNTPVDGAPTDQTAGYSDLDADIPAVRAPTTSSGRAPRSDLGSFNLYHGPQSLLISEESDPCSQTTPPSPGVDDTEDAAARASDSPSDEFNPSQATPSPDSPRSADEELPSGDTGDDVADAAGTEVGSDFSGADANGDAAGTPPRSTRSPSGLLTDFEEIDRYLDDMQPPRDDMAGPAPGDGSALDSGAAGGEDDDDVDSLFEGSLEDGDEGSEEMDLEDDKEGQDYNEEKPDEDEESPVEDEEESDEDAFDEDG